jgi:hypothetical protein
VIRRFAVPIVLGALLAGILAAAAFAALRVLPRPTPSVSLGERLTESISSVAGVRSVEHVRPRLVVTTVCRRLSGQDYLFTILPHRHFFIDGATLTPLEARWHHGQTLAVEVALSGCPSLLAGLLERLVLPAFQQRAPLRVYSTTLGHRHVYRLSLTSRLELVVDRSTLAPIALQLSLPHVVATSVLTTRRARKSAS